MQKPRDTKYTPERMPDLTETARLQWAEHSYPVKSRGMMSEGNRRKPARTHKASEVRIGIRTPSGGTYMGMTGSELAQRRAEELANRIFDHEEHKRKMQTAVGTRQAEIEHWS